MDALLTLLVYVLVVVAHILIILMSRSYAIFSGAKTPSGFGKSRNDSEDSMLGRIAASHANCLENLPLFASVVLVNKVSNGPDLSALAKWYLTARLAQISFHVLGVTDNLVTLRFNAFVTQLALLGYMGWITAAAI